MTKKTFRESCEIAFEYRRGDDPPDSWEVDALVIAPDGKRYIGAHYVKSSGSGWSLNESENGGRAFHAEKIPIHLLRWKEIGRTSPGHDYMEACKNIYSKLL